jgi:PqqD family protein of HPr-rel-A system
VASSVVTDALNAWELALPREQLLYEQFDDEIALFDPISWDTHILTPAGAAIFSELVLGPRSTAELQALFFDAADDPDAVELGPYFEQALDSLCAAGLVRPRRH